MQQHFPARLEQKNQEPNPIYFPFIKSISLFPIYLLLYTAVGMVLIIVRSYIACAMHTWKGFSTYGYGSNPPENPLAQKRIGGVRFGSSLDKFLFKFHSSYSHRTSYVLLSHRGKRKNNCFVLPFSFCRRCEQRVQRHVLLSAHTVPDAMDDRILARSSVTTATKDWWHCDAGIDASSTR